MSDTNNEDDGRDLIDEQVLGNSAVKLLIEIENGSEYAGELYRKTGITYSHIIKVLGDMEPKYLRFESSGRKKLIHLTETGESVAQALTKVNNEVEGYEENTQGNSDKYADRDAESGE